MATCIQICGNSPHRANQKSIVLYAVPLTHYAADIERLWRGMEALADTSNPLTRHHIAPSARQKLVRWIRRVLALFECSRTTYFLAVKAMDTFCRKTKRCLEEEELHLLGITCMFISSKFEDISPLKMTVLHDRIAHSKFSRLQITRAESEVLLTLDFSLAVPTAHHFLEKFVARVGFQSRLAQEALALAELAMWSWKLAVMPQWRLAKAVELAITGECDTIVREELKVQVEKCWASEEDCSTLAALYPLVDLRALYMSLS